MIVIVHVMFLAISNTSKVNSFYKALIASLQINKAPKIVLLENSDYVDVFSPKLIVELSKYIRINNHAINLVNSKEPPY